MTVPPVCHQDDVLKTSIQPGDPPFEYRFRIPADEPPGPVLVSPAHPRLQQAQVLGGASGALIVEGIERANPEIAGLPERVLVIRDQDLLNPDAPPSKSEPVVPKMFIDRDGDSANNGTGFGKPAKDLSINFVPVPYPDYPPATITMKPGERQLWRVLNASAITYLNLAVLFDRAPQQLGIVAIDGVPLELQRQGRQRRSSGAITSACRPGARVEFIVDGAAGGRAGAAGDPNGRHRAGRRERSESGAGVHRSPQPTRRNRGRTLPAVADAAAAARVALVGRRRSGARAQVVFLGKTRRTRTIPTARPSSISPSTARRPRPSIPRPTHPTSSSSKATWRIGSSRTAPPSCMPSTSTRSIFMLLDWSGMPVNEPFLRDTVNVPYFNGRMLQYPSVRLRMDFRDPNIVGTFVYHCHLLEHEDGGMMGTIRVDPPGGQLAAVTARRHRLESNGKHHHDAQQT